LVADFGPLYEACRNKLQVTLDYTKGDGTTVFHTGGIYEIDSVNGKIWLWDVTLNDTIRQFYMNRVNNFQILDATFFPPQPYPIKIDGEIIA